MKPRTFYKWYMDYISDYHEDKKEGKFAKEVVFEVDPETAEIKKEQIVHILKPENVGQNMCIDEKMIDKQYVTILSNQQTGKIALLVVSLKPKIVKQALTLLGVENIEKVENISCDMSPTIKKLCEEIFVNAAIVIDKFHVIKQILDALISIRMGIKYAIKEKKKSDKNQNGWTDLELLEKTRYLLYKREGELDSEQKILLNSVLDKHEKLKTAYRLTQEIRKWYDKSNIGKSTKKLNEELAKWKEKALESNIKEFKKLIKMFGTHHDEILNYFKKGLTNAKAETLNGNIQRFITSNRGTRNLDFFLYRVQVYFA